MASETLTLLRTTMPEYVWAFAESFMVTLNAKDSAKAIGLPNLYRELWRDDRVQQCIRAMQFELREAHASVRDQALGMLGAMLTWDPAQAVDKETGQMLPLHQMPESVRVAIKSWQTKPDGTFKVTFVDRLQVARTVMQMTDGLGAGGSYPVTVGSLPDAAKTNPEGVTPAAAAGPRVVFLRRVLQGGQSPAGATNDASAAAPVDATADAVLTNGK